MNLFCSFLLFYLIFFIPLHLRISLAKRWLDLLNNSRVLIPLGILSPIFRKLLPQVVSCPLAILFPDKHAVAKNLKPVRDAEFDTSLFKRCVRWISTLNISYLQIKKRPLLNKLLTFAKQIHKN